MTTTAKAGNAASGAPPSRSLTPELRSEVGAARGGAAARLLRHLLRPHWLIVVPLFLSFLAWVLPWGSHVERGFAIREPFTIRAAVVLALWYGLAFVAAFVGFRAGSRIRPLGWLDAVPAPRYYLWLTALSTVGVSAAYAKLVVDDPGLIVRSLRTKNFNQVRYALDYGAGIQTLRYAAILAGGIALYNLFIRRRFAAVHVLNLVLLLAAAALSSRLSLIVAVLIALALYAWGSAARRESLKGAAILAVVAFLALMTFNYIRNGGYYRYAYGVTNPFTANLYQSLAYLGAPFQASVAVARRATLPSPDLDLLADGDVEHGTTDWWGWGNEAPAPVLSVTHDRRYVVHGRSALLARVSNPTPQSVDKYVFATPLRIQTPTGTIGVSQGERLYLSAHVAGGQASPASPIQLGIRVFSGPSAGWITQQGITPVGLGLTKTWEGKPNLLSGVFTVPRGMAEIQIAVWKHLLPGESARFAVDRARLYPVEVSGKRIRPRRPSLPRGIARYLLPTYAPVDFKDVLRVEENYRRLTDVQPNLTTNSIYAPMRLSVGNWAFALMALVAFLAAAFAGHASRYRSYFLLATVVAGYCFAEYWRTYLFNFGIIHFLILSLLLIPVADALLQRVRRRFR